MGAGHLWHQAEERATGRLGARGCVAPGPQRTPGEEGGEAQGMGAPLLLAACPCTGLGETGNPTGFSDLYVGVKSFSANKANVNPPAPLDTAEH